MVLYRWWSLIQNTLFHDNTLRWYNPAPTMQLLQDQYIRPMSVLKRIHCVNEGEKKFHTVKQNACHGIAMRHAGDEESLP